MRQEIKVGLTVGPVVCRMCDRPVDRVAFWEDTSTDELVMVAHCHGAEDERCMPNKLLLESEAYSFEEALARGGEAFTTPLIGGPDDD